MYKQYFIKINNKKYKVTCDVYHEHEVDECTPLFDIKNIYSRHPLADHPAFDQSEYDKIRNTSLVEVLTEILEILFSYYKKKDARSFFKSLI